MEELKDLLDKLIYLDPDFISSMYEEIRNVSPATEFTRTEGINADGGLPFLKAGVHSQETKKFSLSSVQMVKDIYESLEDYPELDVKSFKNSQGTKTAWIEGRLTMGEWKESGKAEPPFIIFEINSQTEYSKHSLIIQPDNFSAGIGALLTVHEVLRSNMDIPVRALVRILYLVERIPSFITYPYLIVESEING
jgi:hypothetical protein